MVQPMTQATAALSASGRPATGAGRPAAGGRLALSMVAVAVAAFVAALLFVPAEALVSSRTAADEPQYLLTSISLAEDHSLDIADELSAARWREFAGHDLPRQTEPTRDGREISPHDPGLPALLAAPVAIGGWVGAKVALAAVNGALAAVLLWAAVRRYRVSRRVAVPVVLALTLAPPLAVYGAQVYPELPGALCVAGIVALTGAARRRGAATAGVVALAVAAAWLSIKYVPVAGAATALALWASWRRGDRRAVGVALSASAVLGVLWAVAHVAWYGGLTPYASGDFFATSGGQLAVMGDHPDRLARSVRLLGLLVDRDFGLGAWQPLWLLVVPALAVVLVRRPPRWPSIAAPLAAGWVMGTWVAVTMHGWWFPGRHVVHALPCAVLAIAWWLDRLAVGRVVAWTGVALGAISSAWLAAPTAFGGVTLVFDPWATADPVLRAMQPLLPNMRASGFNVGVRYVAWLVVLLGVAALAVRHERRRDGRSVLDHVVPEAVP
jgi:hypothetical protein